MAHLRQGNADKATPLIESATLAENADWRQRLIHETLHAEVKRLLKSK